jgi:spore germination cell wall hydrolase CwlJ-like protein
MISFVVIAETLDFVDEAKAMPRNTSYEVYTVELDYAETYCLAQNIFFEAGNQSLEGMAAVADVTINRVENSRYPDTVCGVVYQGLKHADGQMKRNKCQFSWYCDGKSDRIPSTQMHNFENAQNIANAMLLEYELRQTHWLGITEGSTHYHAHYVVPNWIHDNGMKRKKQIGRHIFYKFK